jgi:hypothetical protein
MTAARGELPPLEESPIYLLGRRYDPDVGGLLTENGRVYDELQVDGGGRGGSRAQCGRTNDDDDDNKGEQQKQGGAGDEDDDDYGPPTVFTMLHGAERRWASFLTHFRSVVWCTYRAAFPRLGSDAYTSDMGWGCMLRTGQMVLAQALTRHLLGTDWRRQSDRSSPLYAKAFPTPRRPCSLVSLASKAQ